ncbi:hypothetical protein CN130_11020 [Sinorhizobium meliloti]|uniref:hypothetical protein n=1 Tax=Rhizobium meliloti TaxID=382 RepID=UPI000FD71C56|nr:hypothetical protein [Sinorhizobium meliloti]RVM34248.1 hypothetical protein CN130_11020 [Sinorhizobium meliloti]
MIKLTRSNGNSFDLDGTTVLRIRKTVADWDNDLGNTLVNASQNFFVMEEASAVADLVRSELPSLSLLTQPGGSPIWIDAHSAKGPMPVAPSHLTDGINSALDVGGKRQYVHETHQQVRDFIQAANGDVQPIPDDTFWTQSTDVIEQILGGVEDWDPDRGVEQPTTAPRS